MRDMRPFQYTGFIRRYMRRFLARHCVFTILLSPLVLPAQPDNALAVYKTGDYKTALPLLQAAVANAPKDPVIHAALLSALVYEGRVDDASAAAETDAADFPNSPEVVAARGEFAYYMGDMGEAQELFKAAVKMKEETPRAYYGLYRLFHAACMYRTARLLCLRAHELDPDDALITRAWLGYLAPEKRRELLGPFIEAHPWFYKHAQQDRDTASEVSQTLDGRKAFELEGEPQETTLHLIPIMSDPRRIRGLGLEFRIGEGHRLKLLFDTGGNGILINQRAVDREGLDHLGSLQDRGVGDKGPRSTFVSVADTCAIGTMNFKTCIIRATEGKGRVAGDDEDGLIGADFFADYIIQIDFQKRLLHLTPQPARAPNPQGYDRVIGPEEKGFAPVFRYGPHLFVSTTLNGKSTGLFLLDTGASLSNVDSTFARLSTKIHGSNYLRIHGVSGEVKDVFEADKAVIQFAGYRQQNLGLIAFNLNNSPDHQEVRMAGILGIPVLSMFRLTLDYRNALVKFDYALK